MVVKKSIEVWIVAEDDVLLLTVPAVQGAHPSFSQPITGGREGCESATEACLREIEEETGARFDAASLLLVREGVFVPIDDKLTIEKTIFLLKTTRFKPRINPAEHEAYRWVKTGDVEAALFYSSNKTTWTLARNFKG